MICGGVDIGGTKIEARLFSPELTTLETRRIATPTRDLNSFLDALANQVEWLQARSGIGAKLPIGIAQPGLVDPQSGVAFAANVPISGRDVAAELAERIGRILPAMNDCQAFTLSETREGAGDGFASVVGLVIGTGVAAGFVLAGATTPRLNGSAIEIGHVGVPARLLLSHGLPLWRCGCGKLGCFEPYASGTGLTAIGRHRLGRSATAEELIAEAADGSQDCAAVLDEWSELVGELLYTIQVLLDPDCIVIGGGVSRMPDITIRLSDALMHLKLGEMRLPQIRVARHGDSSGARGVALMARDLAAAAAQV